MYYEDTNSPASPPSSHETDKSHFVCELQFIRGEPTSFMKMQYYRTFIRTIDSWKIQNMGE